MKTITLPCYGIKIELIGLTPAAFGVLTSNLHVPEMESNEHLKASIDAIERLVVAHACAGVEVNSPTYVCGLRSAIDLIAKQHSVEALV
jgi:hypothetical protein